MKDSIQDPEDDPENHCFNIDSIMDNCIPVYINVNVHFFLDSTSEGCGDEFVTGPKDSSDHSAFRAFEVADKMIKDANEYMATLGVQGPHSWGAESHGGVRADTICVPIRYVLNAVEIHCDSKADSAYNFGPFSSYYRNSSTEMNIFVSNVLLGSNGAANGFAFINGRSIVVENFSAGLFNHEFGHTFGLDHTFDEDICDDVWGKSFSWTWDYLCDSIDVQSGITCWNRMSVYKYIDPNGDTTIVNTCDSNEVCETHPCCEWKNISNNVMGYSQFTSDRFTAAFSPCQVRRMLEHIANAKCDYVESVGGCPPPKAYIGLLPPITEVSDCPSCFYLSASFNETYYEIEIRDSTGNIVVQTGDIFTEAEKYCITPKIDGSGPYWGNGFTAGNEYTISLKVGNDCGVEHIDEYTFRLPPPCNPSEVPLPDIFVVGLVPNPTSQLINIEIDSDVTGVLTISGINTQNGVPYSNPIDFNITNTDGQVLTIDVSSWQNGVNTLILQIGNELHTENFIKY